MKTLAVFFVIILILIAGYFQIMKIWNNVNFDFNFNLSGIDLTNLASGSIVLPINATVTNDNGFSIPFKNVKALLYYKGNLIAQTSGDLASQSFNLPAHGSIPVLDPNATILLNSVNLGTIKDLASHPMINYTVSLSVFGIPFSYSDSFMAG